MMKRESLQPAFVLHRRAYRETSFLIDIFTIDHGRVSVISKGARSSKHSLQGLLQAFNPLSISWSGKGELLSLTHAEARGGMCMLKGNCLFAGFYLNELLVALLDKWDPHPNLFISYESAIAALQTNELDERVLRTFEKRLLEELGYGLLPKIDHARNDDLLHDKYYRFVPEDGFVQSDLGYEAKDKINIFSGKRLHAIANEDWQDEETLRDAKRLTRLVLLPLLGRHTIYSRQLFMPLGESASE